MPKNRGIEPFVMYYLNIFCMKKGGIEDNVQIKHRTYYKKVLVRIE
ncbi:MAG: hypothetical protein IJD40_07125 [Lachnospiraceae bacterium]|nr:hypothetical protein [Lachnospiraceae bacterium]